MVFHDFWLNALQPCEAQSLLPHGRLWLVKFLQHYTKTFITIKTTERKEFSQSISKINSKINRLGNLVQYSLVSGSVRCFVGLFLKGVWIKYSLLSSL